MAVAQSIIGTSFKTRQVFALKASTYTGNGVWTDTISNKAFTLNNGPTWSDTNGGQFRFDANSGQWADTAPGTSLPGMSSFTIQGVFKIHTVPDTGFPCLITENWPGSGTKINYALGFINTQTTIAGGFFNSNEGFWNTADAITSVDVDTWYDVVCSFHSPSKTVKTYVNGTLINSATVIGTAGTDNAGIRIARRWDDEQYLDCTIKDINIWSGVLTPNEVSKIHTHYNSLV